MGYNGGEELLEIGNSKRVPKNWICYKITGGHNYPRLERVRVKSGGYELIVDFPDAKGNTAMKIVRGEVFETPEEAVAHRVAVIEEQAREAVTRTKELLR